MKAASILRRLHAWLLACIVLPVISIVQTCLTLTHNACGEFTSDRAKGASLNLPLAGDGAGDADVSRLQSSSRASRESAYMPSTSFQTATHSPFATIPASTTATHRLSCTPAYRRSSTTAQPSKKTGVRRVSGTLAQIDSIGARSAVSQATAQVVYPMCSIPARSQAAPPTAQPE
jgi:hypothetical protein